MVFFQSNFSNFNPSIFHPVSKYHFISPEKQVLWVKILMAFAGFYPMKLGEYVPIVWVFQLFKYYRIECNFTS